MRNLFGLMALGLVIVGAPAGAAEPMTAAQAAQLWASIAPPSRSCWPARS